MAELGLTTADNYLTLVVNGTTMKQLWAQQRNADGTLGTRTKIYQKWKTEVYDAHYNTADHRIYAYTHNIKTWYSGRYRRGSSYSTYQGQLRIDRSWVGNDDYVDYQDEPSYMSGSIVIGGTTVCSGTTSRTNPGQGTQDYAVNSVNNYTTIYARNDSSYHSKLYSVNVYYNWRQSDGNIGSGTASGYTPTNTSRKSGTVTNTHVNAVTQWGYNSIERSRRVEDN